MVEQALAEQPLRVLLRGCMGNQMRAIRKLAALAFCLTGAALCPVLAQSALSAQPRPIIVDTRATTDAGRSVFADLDNKADRQGRVRVIVHIDIKSLDDHPLHAQEDSNQLRRLPDVQRRVIERGLISKPDATLFKTIPYFSAFVTAQQLARLMRDPDVVSIQEDIPDLAGVARSKAGPQPRLVDSPALIGAAETWTRGITGAGQVIALVETGVDRSHPMLKGKVVAGLCRSTIQPPIFRSLCPGGVASSDKLGSGRPCNIAGCEVGTGSASVIAGNTSTLKGVAPDAKIISAQVFSKLWRHGCDYDRPCPTSFATDQISALERILLLRQSYNIAAVVLNVSGNAQALPCERDPRAVVIKKLYQANIPTIVAGGNGPYLHLIGAPACISMTVAAGATTKQDLVWQYSLHSLMVDLMAPGENIYAAMPGGGYGFFVGTGMAAAHIAGAIALLKQARPNATAYQLLNALRNTGVPVDRYSSAPGGVPTQITQIRIDVAKALTRLEEMIPAAQQTRPSLATWGNECRRIPS
jgi:subtilisin